MPGARTAIGACWFGVAGVDRDGFRGLQMRHRMGDGAQIVQQGDPAQTEVGGQCGFAQVPWQVGQVRAPVDHRPGDVEAGGGGSGAGAGQERFDDRLQAGVIGAGEFLFGDECARAGVGRDECQSRRGATDIARDQHYGAAFQSMIVPGTVCWFPAQGRGSVDQGASAKQREQGWESMKFR